MFFSRLKKVFSYFAKNTNTLPFRQHDFELRHILVQSRIKVCDLQSDAIGGMGTGLGNQLTLIK